ncbi:decarboxylase [Candidatus Woesearchaeota archaeon CG10_big_fil_rev_8_21_14_0_10_45_16]|nr:MAG: decarboxylase [Candidatus Woesearchaeota archaeon CG10_big_fil_rev_8_21_14_0_10_45_16]
MKPRFTLSKSTILQQYRKVKEAADIVAFSSKTNPLVTPILEDNSDALFSIHMVNELKHIKDKRRVVFLAQAWDEQQIKELLDQKVNRFVVDNESDLDVLLLFLEKNEVREKINLLLRMKVKENTLRTERYFVFGMDSDVVKERVEQIHKKYHDKIDLGVHFHRKTQNMSEWNLGYQITRMLGEEVLQKISVINIGGGLPSEYANTNVDVLPGIFKKIEELKLFLSGWQIKLMIEPGRFIAAPAGKLYAQIIAIYDHNIIINASVYNSDMDAILVPAKLLVEGELPNGSGQAYVIKGVTPCSMDLFRYRVYLNDPKVGDMVTFLNAGAYNFTTDFCDLEKIETEVVE